MSAADGGADVRPSAPPKMATRAIGHKPRLARFLGILVAVTAIAHIGPFFAVHALAQGLGAPHPWIPPSVLLVAGLALFLGRARIGMADRPRPRWLTMLLDEPYYVHWTACLFQLLASVVVVPIGAIAGFGVERPLLAAYALGLVVCGYGVVVRRRWLAIERVEVSVRGLPRAFDGVRIAHLSDLHIGALTPRSRGLRWVEVANAERPDIAVVTGDMVTNGILFHRDIADVVGALRATHGTFACMGNHDYFGEGEPLGALLEERGVRVLRNEGQCLERDGQRLYLAGIDDTWTKRDDVARAMSGKPDGVRSVLLAHDPARFHDATEQGADVVLSGHTHGGQIAVPFFARRASLSHLTHRYHLGLYRHGDSTLYVHPGLGTTGPPIRLGVAPAVTILTLRAA